MDWIKTEDELPPHSISVLVVIQFNEHRYVDIGTLLPDRPQATFHCTHQVWIGKKNVTHWMKKPELPPKDDKKV